MRCRRIGIATAKMFFGRRGQGVIVGYISRKFGKSSLRVDHENLSIVVAMFQKLRTPRICRNNLEVSWKVDIFFFAMKV